MTPITRRYILIFFVMAFFITAPILLLYAMGYRYNFKKGEVESVGAFFLDAQPNNATIYINENAIEKQKVPIQLSDLIPQKYKLSIEKEGYFKWEKTLQIESNQTTFANKIILFKKTEPELIKKGEINLFIKNQTQTHILFSLIDQAWEELWLKEINDSSQSDKNIKLLYRVPIKNQTDIIKQDNVSWSSDGKKILFSHKDEYFILQNKTSSTPISLKNISSINIGNIQWDNENSNILYGNSNNDLYKIELEPFSIKLLIKLPENAIQNSFRVLKDEIIYVQKNDYSHLIKTISIKNNINIKTLLQINEVENDNLKISIITPYMIEINYPERSYIIRVNTTPIGYENIQTNDLLPDPTNHKMLYHNGYELWSTEFDKDYQKATRYLLTRTGEKIQKIDWHAMSEYVFFTTENSLTAIELDGRDKRNTYDIIENFQIDNFTSNKDSTYIYLSGYDKQNKIYGIFQHEITEKQAILPFDLFK